MSADDNQKLVRRQVLKAGATGAAWAAFAALGANSAEAKRYGRSGGGRAPWHKHGEGYGELKPCQDLTTGLTLLALPEGFSYMSFGWTGQIMSDGRPTPTDHDGMAVVGRHGKLISLVRNHELSAGESSQCLVEGGMYNPAEFGGTTNLYFDLARGCFVDSYTSLGGTIRNCAGGLTPWNSWVSCEETFHEWGDREDGFNHGYVFDVPGFGTASGKPVRAAGRFSHEAVAIDPATDVMYETEDTGESGFYKYVQPGAGHRRWQTCTNTLRDGGELYAMVVEGVSRNDMRVGFSNGDTFKVSWQKVQDPEGKEGRAFESAPDAAIFARGEGCWYDSGKIYFVSTSGGEAGLGQVWVYDPRCEKLTMLYESRDSADVDGPDNIAISPRGGIILCEDGDSDPKRLISLSQTGIIAPFAENRIELVDGDIDAIDKVYPGTKANLWDEPVGNYTSREWAGACFYGDWLFANIQSPGVTFAITGPWRKGSL